MHRMGMKNATEIKVRKANTKVTFFFDMKTITRKHAFLGMKNITVTKVKKLQTEDMLFLGIKVTRLRTNLASV